MFTKNSSALFLVLALAALPMAAMAQSAPATSAPVSSAPAKQKWDSMTLQQKQQVIADHEAKKAAMTPTEKAAAKEKAQARFNSMTPEQQAKVKARRAEREQIRKSMPVTAAPVTVPASTPAQ
jgi:hypothetical protein